MGLASRETQAEAAERPRLVLPSFDFLPNRGGQQVYLYEIAQRLSRDWQVLVITTVPGDLPAGHVFQRLLLPSQSVIGLWQTMRRLEPQAILLGHAHPRLMLAATLIRGPGYAALAHGNDFLAAQNRWHRSLFNAMLRRAHPLFCHSQALAGRLRQLGCRSPVVLHPGTDPDRFRPADEPPDLPTLLSISRLVSRKGIDTVLQALPELLKSFPGLRYKIGGTGPDRSRLEQLAAELGVAHAVDFLGFIPDEQLPEVYRRATLFVMPSREEPARGSIEGFGIVFLEANASGIPVVAAASGGMADAVRDGETGFLVPPDDPRGLAQALRRLLSDVQLCRNMGRAGRKWVVEEMNWERVGQEMSAHLLKKRP